jgi:glycosyltransferase involved in cell wall biosynthesis
MARASIFTLDPHHGGVPALARATRDFLASSGHEPSLVFRATDDVPVSRLGALRHFLSTPPVRREMRDGTRIAAVAAYPLSPRFQYHLPRLARAEAKAPILAAVSGSAHAALPLALARRPYVLWVATLYGDEVRARADVGDVWAKGLLASRDWPALERQERLCLERASAVLALSPHTHDRIAAFCPGARDRLRTVLYPVDTDRFRPVERAAKPPGLLLTARIRDPRKNPGLLLHAFARLRASHPDLRLVIAGDEPPDEIRDLAARLGVAGGVSFRGWVEPDALVALYRDATVFTFPSRQEGLGISVAEAMACGLPVVATRCGGPESLVVDGVTGRLVPNGDESAFAGAIDGLLRDPARRIAMGVAGRAEAERRFSRPRVEAALRAAFRDVFGAAF